MTKSVIILTLLVLPLISPAFGQYQPPHQRPGPAVDKVGFKAFAVEIAPLAIEDNLMDMYMFALKTAAAKEILNKPDLQVNRAPATSISIILNPAPAPEDQFNPFSIREIRSALQYLVNREFIVSEIYQGLAAPMLTHISPFDFDYLTLFDLVKKSNIQYDPEFAKIIIENEMLKAGATMDDGRWKFNNRPIILKFVIRVEDERKDIGDLIASELDNLGFQVERVYHNFGPAIHKVYGTDPALHEWHLYTEGWSRGSAEKYDYATLNQMIAPWFGNMPGWQEVGFYQYENSTLDEISKKIFTGDFIDIQERNSLYRMATEIALAESIRIWTVNVMNSYTLDQALEGVTNDLASGPRSIWTLREAYIPDKSNLTIGNLWVWTERTIWNPVGGFGDIYSVDIWQNIHDPPVWIHPFTGIPIPFRTTYDIDTAGPNGKIDIPASAFRWDPDADSWSGVGSGSKATSKVTFDYSKYIGSKWHHGIPITMADILYSIYQKFDLTYSEEKSKIEFAAAVVSKPYLDTFKGFRIVDETKLEVYIDYWHFIPDYIAQYAQPADISMPWEILSAMDNLVFEKRTAAYSDTASEKFQVPWLNLVMENDARLVRNVINEFSRNEIFPDEVFTVNGEIFVSLDDALERYEAAASWFNEKKILVISNGPFILSEFDPRNQYAELIAFRDPTYPFKPGDWYFGDPQLVEISEVQGASIQIGSESSFEIEISGPGKIGVRYILIDPVNGEILKTGDASPATENKQIIDIESDVTSGMVAGAPYNLIIAAYSEDLSYVSERIQSITVVTKTTTTSTTTTTSSTTNTTTTTSTTTTMTTSSPSTTDTEEDFLSSYLFIILGIIIIVVIVAILILRRR
jgi:peptide/nickel transport system substrate-binding protein